MSLLRACTIGYGPLRYPPRIEERRGRIPTLVAFSGATAWIREVTVRGHGECRLFLPFDEALGIASRDT